MTDYQTVYIIKNRKIISKRTKDPKKLEKSLKTKVYLRERFAKCALTRLYGKKDSVKKDNYGNPRVRIFIIENGQVVSKRTRNPSKYTPYFTSIDQAKRANTFDYTLTCHSVNVIIGTDSQTIMSTDRRFKEIRQACINNNVEMVIRLISLDKVIAKETKGVFTTKDRGRKVFIDNQELPKGLGNKIARMMKNEQPTDSFLAFWNRLKKNPDKRVRENLYEFISKIGCALTTDGFILAYKYVNKNYTSCYNGKFDWTPGKQVEMPRKSCDDDPHSSCSSGLHVGSYNYVRNTSHIVLLVKIDPKDVVSVPYDYNCEKMRCCRVYSVCHAKGMLKQDLVSAEDVEKWTINHE